jgi:hypothetical protein
MRWQSFPSRSRTRPSRPYIHIQHDGARTQPTPSRGTLSPPLPPPLLPLQALERRKKHLPSYIDRATGKTTLYKPCGTRTGRFCPDNALAACCDPCREGNVSSFAPFGAGISSYFKVQKSLMSAFFVLALLAIPSITINTFGGGQDEGGAGPYTIAKTTLGNLVGTTNASTVIDLPYTKVLYPISEAAVVYASLDVIGVVVMCLTYLIVRRGLEAERKQVEGNSICAKDYSVVFPWLPSDTTEEELRAWVRGRTATKRRPEGYEVADVNMIDDNTGLLRIYQIRGALYRGLIRIDQAISELEHALDGRPAKMCCDSEYARLRVLKRTHDALTARAQKYTQEAQNFKSRGVVGAFVTFDSPVGASLLLDKYPPTTVRWLCQGKKGRFKGHRIVVHRAPEPSTVLWQNLNISATQQTVRQTFTGIAAFLLILCSFAFIVFASMKNTEFAVSGFELFCRGGGGGGPCVCVWCRLCGVVVARGRCRLPSHRRAPSFTRSCSFSPLPPPSPPPNIFCRRPSSPSIAMRTSSSRASPTGPSPTQRSSVRRQGTRRSCASARRCRGATSAPLRSSTRRSTRKSARNRAAWPCSSRAPSRLQECSTA